MLKMYDVSCITYKTGHLKLSYHLNDNFTPNITMSPKPRQIEKERKNEGGRRVCSSHIVVCYCAILPDPLQESPGWKEGEEEEVEEEEDTFTGQRENTSTATVWTRLCNIHTHRNSDALMNQLKSITDECQLKTTEAH